MNEHENSVQITVDKAALQGDLTIPAGAGGIVLFAHGSGSSRQSPRNKFVARALREAELATLLLDLMTLEEEAQDLIRGHLRFNIPFLSRRLAGATDWVRSKEDTKKLKIGYFGASTGAAAALLAASEKESDIEAIVSRGGRPDLAGPALSRVKAPTLLIVGGEDLPVITLNQQALRELRVEKELVIVPRATHLFEEPGTLEEVARLAREWFVKYLTVKSAT